MPPVFLPFHLTMEKAFLLVSTVLLAIVSLGLPKLNASTPLGEGKIIKAALFSSSINYHGEPDSLIQLEIFGLKKRNFQIRTVVIDPGHGGHDPGCSGANSREKHNCLAIGKYFAEALKLNFPGLNVIMTRSTDVFIPLNERAAIATRNHADLFISIHCNFIPNASHVHGAETYVLGLHATKENLEVAKRENASILYEENYQETYGYDPNSPEAHILFSMFQNAYLEQSILFAQKVQQSMGTEANRKNRGVKQAGFLVLRHATMPSVLVETGYLSNRNEEDFIRSKKGQKAIANSLLVAFHDYKTEAEGSARLLALKKLDDSKEEDFTAEFVTTESTAPTPEENKTKPVNMPENITPAASNAERRTNTSPIVTENVSKNSLSSDKSQPQKETFFVPEPTRTSETQTAGSKILPSNPISSSPAPATLVNSQIADIQYRVQLAASPSLIDLSRGKWSNVDYLIEVVEEDRLFKYQVCNFATLEDANQAKLKLRSLGFSDAFVVAYQNGQRTYPGQIKN